jgi:hypothetical protein
MRIGLWTTKHEISDTVARAASDGFGDRNVNYTTTNDGFPDYVADCVAHEDIHIGYGILRGMADVFRECDKQGKPWFCIDKGYWKPSHYDGYYRVSLRGTQQCGVWPEPDYERWERLQIPVEPFKKHYHVSMGRTLVCPPTDYAKQFFGVDWQPTPRPDERLLIREKGCERSLDEDFEGCSLIRTFNSSIGWEAIRRGIPCISDEKHSFVGSYMRHVGGVPDNVESCEHHQSKFQTNFFGAQAACQLTLDEMRGGMLFPLMQKLLDAQPRPA